MQRVKSLIHPLDFALRSAYSLFLSGVYSWTAWRHNISSNNSFTQRSLTVHPDLFQFHGDNLFHGSIDFADVYWIDAEDGADSINDQDEQAEFSNAELLLETSDEYAFDLEDWLEHNDEFFSQSEEHGEGR